jgi:nucleoside-diphosphate-sugar epimerase
VDVTQKLDFKKLPSDKLYAVVNLSGQLPARMAGYNPQEYIDVNLTGSLNIFEYAVAAGAERIVSTQSISDVAHLCGNKNPIDSDSQSLFPLNNDHSIYSITKTAASNILAHMSCKYGFKYFVLRFPNIYLYHPNPYYYVDGEEKWQGYRLIIHKAIHGEPLAIWGDPSKVRDIVYVKDCTQIIERCLSAPNPDSGMYNVGTGVGVSMENQVLGIINVFCPQKNKSVVTYDVTKPDTTEYIFDISKTSRNLGYVPVFSYIDYLNDFKNEMKSQRFVKLWGNDLVEDTRTII